MSYLSCQGLTRRPWFEDRGLELERGEIVVLSGPTGSGKTLFLRALADLDPCESGAAFLEGRERSAMSGAEWRSRVLYVHQSGVRLPGSVDENLARVAGLAPGRRPEPVPGLDGSADAGRLSGGEAQALALQRALLCEPAVLLLDESTAALDPEAAAGWEARLRAWVDGGRALLWVSHDGALAGRVGARVERFP